jgi:hypothetical protein
MRFGLWNESVCIGEAPDESLSDSFEGTVDM